MIKNLKMAAMAVALVTVPAVSAVARPGPQAALPACALSDITPAALACTGFFAGNLLSGSGGDILAQQAGLAPLGLNWDGIFANVTKINSLSGATTVDFSTANQNPIATMFGVTYVGFHFGNGSPVGNATAFYRLDAGVTGLQSILLSFARGSSGAVLYRTGQAPPPPPPAVPEPASWAMMIAGFGLVGASMRRRRVPLRTVAA